jgi:hypothetical protein
MVRPESKTEATPQRSGVRQGIAIALAVLFGIVLVVGNHAGWLATTVLKEDVFVRTLEPLPNDPAVAKALADNVAAGVIESFEVKETIAEKLPENLAFIAAPLANGLEGIVSEVVSGIIETDAFTTVWSVTLKGAHKAASIYIGTFEGDILTTEDGSAVLDFTDIGAQIKDELDDRGFDVLDGSDADLQIELFELPDSGPMYELVRLMTSLRWATIIATLLFLAGAYAVATNRRKISVWIGGATMLAMIVSLVDIRYARSAVTGGIEDPVQQAGAIAAWDIIFRRFVAQSWVILLIGVAVVSAAWIFGDSDRAASVRATLAKVSGLGNGDEASAFAVFVATHRRLLEWGIVIGAGAVLLLGPTFPIAAILFGIVGIFAFIAGVEIISASAGSND